jgi:hypothetical protein
MTTDKTREKWDEKIDRIYTYLINGDLECSDEEIEFIDLIFEKREKGLDISYPQRKELNRIFEKIKKEQP